MSEMEMGQDEGLAFEEDSEYNKEAAGGDDQINSSVGSVDGGDTSS